MIGMVVVTLIAAGGGVGMSLLTPHSQESEHATQRTSDEPEKEKSDNEESEEENKKSVLIPLRPIITNIGNKSKTLIRIESVLVFKAEHSGTADYIADKVAEDILVYLKTISLSDIEGASGLVNLIDDLNARVVARSEDHVSEILIQSLVVE